MSTVAVYLTMLMLGANFSSTTVEKQPTAYYATAVQMTEEEQRFMDLTNAERADRGLGLLTYDPILVEAARKHSKEMCDKSYFDHVSPTSGVRTVLDRYLAELDSKPQWALVGENLFYCSIVDVNRGHTCLMNSRSHRKNILDPRFHRMGVGVYKNESGQFWVTEMFVSTFD